MISRDVIETIRERVDIVEVVSQVVTLKRKGSSYVGLCPFHQEKTPSFNVVPSKGIFHCFGCGEGGDVFKFVQKTRGLEFGEVVRELAATCGVVVEERELSQDERRRIRARADVHEVCEKACQHFQNVLLARPEGQEARDYLERRGLSRELVERYRLGYAPPTWDGLLNYLHRQGISVEMAVSAGLARERERGQGAYDLFRGRVIVPIEDSRGRVVAFGGRILPGLDTRSARHDAPKYVNSPETEIYRKSTMLYGLSHARTAVQRTGRLLVVEGYFDVLSLHQAGFREAVATCGTALTSDHVRIIRPLTSTVVALFDADEAGLRAAERSLELFLAAGIEPRRLDIGGSKDPDEFILSEGAEAFQAALDQSEPLFELVLRRAIQRNGATPGGRDATLRELAPLVRLHPSGARSVVMTRVASALGLHEAAVTERVGSAGAPQMPTSPEPARWTGHAELNHLLWLLVHFRDKVLPVVAEVDPEIVTDRPTALQAIGMLMSGAPLASVLADVPDPDLHRVLRVAAAREDLYDEQKAASAARQIVDRMRLNRIKAELLSLDRELSTCTLDGDRSRYFSLLERRQSLQREKDALQRRSGRKVR